MKNLGSLHHFLGIKVNQTLIGLFLSQTRYVKDLLTRTSMMESKPCGSSFGYKGSSPTTSSTVISNPILYRRITGALQYLTLACPNLAFACNQLCQHMHQASIADSAALKRVLRY